MKIKNEQFFIVLKKYLQVFLIKNRGCSKNTVKSYTDSLNLFFLFMESEKDVSLLKMDWCYFNYENVSEFLVWLGEKRNCGRQTQLLRLTGIRSFVRYGGILDISVTSAQVEIEKVKIRKPTGKLIQYLSKEQLAVLLRQPDASTTFGLRDMVFLSLAYDTAARCQEMVDLKLESLSLNPQNPCVYLTGKGSKTRVVPLMTKTVAHLKNYIDRFHPYDSRKPDAHLFYTTSHGENHRMSEDNAAAFVKKYGETARVEDSEIPERVHPHMIRHTRAMHWYQGGMPLTLIAELMGHDSIQTTKKYAYADTEMKREAIRKANGDSEPEIPNSSWKSDVVMLRKFVGLVKS